MNKLSIYILTIILIVSMTGCNPLTKQNRLQKVGMLLDGTITDNAWNELGYKGLLSIGEQYDVDVLYRTDVIQEQDVIDTVDDFVNKGINLIFGHSNIYGKYFTDIANYYPDVHFVYFNGSYYGDNLSSFSFESHAMGFFGGMVASEMTETNEVGVIAAYEWQPEVEGFYEGAKYYNHDVNVHIKFINNWDDKQLAYDIYDKMRENDVDVFYPSGDYYSKDIIKRASEEDVYTIGYVSDQYDISPTSILTSTVQHVDKLYSIAAERFEQRSLHGGIFTFDFADNVISLGTFNPTVSDEFQNEIKTNIDEYVDTNLLPHQVN